MAIDTKAKRMSMLSAASPLAWQHHFEVDGAVDADDRGVLLHIYAGNALAAALSGVFPTPSSRVFIPSDENRSNLIDSENRSLAA